MTPPLLELVTTVATREQAQALAQAAVQQRLAACVQIESIDSVYRWQGQVCAEPEWRLVCKTTVARAWALERLLLEHHPYDLPALHTVAVAPATAAYAAWVAEQVDDAPSA